jgi:hypothetical protein
MSEQAEQPVALRATHSRDITFDVTARDVRGNVREARVASAAPPGHAFTIISDEGPWSGAESSAPYPLSYFSASLAF